MYWMGPWQWFKIEDRLSCKLLNDRQHLNWYLHLRRRHFETDQIWINVVNFFALLISLRVKAMLNPAYNSNTFSWISIYAHFKKIQDLIWVYSCRPCLLKISPYPDFQILTYVSNLKFRITFPFLSQGRVSLAWLSR